MSAFLLAMCYGIGSMPLKFYQSKMEDRQQEKWRGNDTVDQKKKSVNICLEKL